VQTETTLTVNTFLKEIAMVSQTPGFVGFPVPLYFHTGDALLPVFVIMVIKYSKQIVIIICLIKRKIFINF